MNTHRLLLITLLASSVATYAADYTIDSAHTHARFAIDHFGTSTNQGGFYNLTGKVSYDPKAQKGFVDITIPVKQLETNIPHFDEHLKSADLFNAQKYPTMRFVSKQWHFRNGKPSKIDGQLTLLGQTHPVSLKVDKFNCYQSPILKAPVCGGDLSTTIDRTRWGMNYFVAEGFSKKVHLNIQIEAAKK